MACSYWLNVFTAETWKEFQDHGGDVTGFGEKRFSSVRKIKPGDYLLCYLMGLSRWVGLLEVVGDAYFDREIIWSTGIFPCRLPVRTVLALPPERGVPVLEMREELSVFHNLVNPKYWSGRFQTSPSRWESEDGEKVVRALQRAQKDQ